MTNEEDVMLEILKSKRVEKRKKVAEATGRILDQYNGAYVELDCKDKSLDEGIAAVAKIIEQVIACDNRVSKRATG